MYLEFSREGELIKKNGSTKLTFPRSLKTQENSFSENHLRYRHIEKKARSAIFEHFLNGLFASKLRAFPLKVTIHRAKNVVKNTQGGNLRVSRGSTP